MATIQKCIISRYSDVAEKTEEVRCGDNLMTSRYNEMSYVYCLIITQPLENQRPCAERQLN